MGAARVKRNVFFLVYRSEKNAVAKLLWTEVKLQWLCQSKAAPQEIPLWDMDDSYHSVLS